MHNLIKREITKDDKDFVLSIADKKWESHAWGKYLSTNSFIFYHCNYCNTMYLIPHYKKHQEFIIFDNEIDYFDEILSCEELIIKKILE